MSQMMIRTSMGSIRCCCFIGMAGVSRVINSVRDSSSEGPKEELLGCEDDEVYEKQQAIYESGREALFALLNSIKESYAAGGSQAAEVLLARLIQNCQGKLPGVSSDNVDGEDDAAGNKSLKVFAKSLKKKEISKAVYRELLELIRTA